MKHKQIYTRLFFLIFLFFLKNYTAQCQTLGEFKIVLSKIDSIIAASANDKYETKDIIGKIDSSIGEVEGILYVLPGTKKIKRIRLNSTLMVYETNYYCTKDNFIIISPDLIYYRGGQKVYTFSGKNPELVQKEVQSYLDFFEGFKLLL
jgi:hypothetical protein